MKKIFVTLMVLAMLMPVRANAVAEPTAAPAKGTVAAAAVQAPDAPVRILWHIIAACPSVQPGEAEIRGEHNINGRVIRFSGTITLTLQNGQTLSWSTVPGEPGVGPGLFQGVDATLPSDAIGTIAGHGMATSEDGNILYSQVELSSQPIDCTQPTRPVNIWWSSIAACGTSELRGYHEVQDTKLHFISALREKLPSGTTLDWSTVPGEPPVGPFVWQGVSADITQNGQLSGEGYTSSEDGLTVYTRIQMPPTNIIGCQQMTFKVYLPIVMHQPPQEANCPVIHHQSGSRPVDGGISPGIDAVHGVKFWIENSTWNIATWRITEFYGNPVQTRTLYYANVTCTQGTCQTDLIYGTNQNPRPLPGSQLLVTIQVYPDQGASNCAKAVYVDPPIMATSRLLLSEMLELSK